MPRIGELLADRYRLDAPIGSGGFATVYRARDLRLQRDVAVKVLLENHANDPAIAARFDREARVLAAISHPNVVTVHDVAHGDPATGSPPFIVMDLCEGGSLADRFATSGDGAFPPEELTRILIQIAHGLDALHAQGIIHRDLKPSNILFSDDRPRIADLGIAAVGPSELTATGTTVGTLAYLAPEQLAGEPASAASDVHALGTMAYLGLTGRLPRSAGSYAELVTASALPVEPVSALNPDLGPAFDAVVAEALAVDPARRPTAREFGSALAAALERWQVEPALVSAREATTAVNIPVPAPAASVPAVSAAGDPVTPRQGGRLLLALGVLLVAVLIGLAALRLLGLTDPSGSPSPVPSASVGGSPAATATESASPIATTDPFIEARAASDEMRAAIEDARGAHGLTGREARDLEVSLDRFDSALEAGNLAAAQAEANELGRQVAELIDEGAVDAEGAAQLQTAADALVAATDDLLD